MWTVPDAGEPQNDLQAILFQEYLDVLVAGIAGEDCVLSGGAVTAQGSPNMTVAVAKSAVLSAGVLKATAAWTGTITTADATNPRLDLVVVDSSGAGQVRAGTPAANPKPPARTANDVVLAVVYVPATDTTIGSDQITDMRVMRTKGPTVVDRVTSPVTFNTSSAFNTFYSIVLPSGLFLAGKILRVRLWGNFLTNSGTPTVGFRVTFGGTTMFEDSYGAATADTDRGVWFVDLCLVAQANNDQNVSGVVTRGAIAAKTAPTAGQGDLGTGTSSNFDGAAAIDCDAGDRTLAVLWKTSVSNVANEIVMEGAFAELI